MNRLFKPDRRWRVNSLSGERRVDRFGIPFRPSPNNGEILFRNALLLHHQAETPGCGCVLRHEDEPARFPVESIHDRNLSTIRDLEREQLFQFAPECAGSSRFGRMNKEEGRLFDDNEVVVLRDYREVVCVICASNVRGG